MINVELNEQQVEFLKYNLHGLITEFLDAKNEIIAKQILTALENAKENEPN